MKRKAVSGIMLTLLLISMLTLAFNIRSVKAEPSTIIVPDDYSTIQEAINSASPEDTVFVHNGTYYEHLTIANNNLTIIGENAKTTIIDGSGASMAVVNVDTANNVKISGFTIRDGSEGIELYLSNGNIIRDNTLCSNTHSGITLDSSDSNIVADNTIILNNNIAIELYSSVGNSISGNIMSNNSVGIGLFDGSTDNSIFGNTISYNGYVGVDVWQSGGNAIYHNNFIQNVPQVYSDGVNAWDDGAEGNYWSDYNGTDFYSGPSQNEIDSDGIGDKPYSVNKINQDTYPLMGPISFFDASPWNGVSYSVNIVSNSTVSKFQHNEAEQKIIFYVTGETGLGFCRIGISNIIVDDLWLGEYTLLVDGEEPLKMNNWTDGTYTYIYFTYLHAEREVVIQEPDTTPPIISILSPENKTYVASNVPLTFTVSESTSWIGYSLNGQMNVTTSGNTTTIGLSDGTYTIAVYANDTAGNMGYSGIVYFTVDTVSPNIEILSPENKTYTTSSVSLSFIVDEALSWIGYSLDGQKNVTMTGNTTLSGLSNGLYSIIIFANDTGGNTGVSETIYFTIEAQQEGAFPPAWILVVMVIMTLVGAILLVYFAKVKKKSKRVK